MKFKIGDKVSVDKDDEHFHQVASHADNINKATITNFGQNGWIFIRFDNGYQNSYQKLTKLTKKNMKPKKVNFLLKYDLDEDPIEEFETMKEVNERITYLVENKDSLRRDSIVIYEVKAKHEVKIETKISKKLIK